MTKIPVVYATDENYARYMLVSMYSLMKNLAEDSFCRFIVLVPSGTNTEDISFVGEELKAFDRCSVEYITADDAFNDAELQVERLSSATFFRLGLPAVLPDEDRCIYIDCDTIVVGDITELWNEDIGDALIGGVEGHNFTTRKKKNRTRLNWDEDVPFEYINAGVLIMDLAGMRRDDMVSVFNSMDPANYHFADQDIINIACAGRITYIPCRYNVRPYYTGWYAEITDVPEIQTKIEEALADPVIYHYASIHKPWNDIETPFGEVWLEYALSDDLAKYFADVEALKNDTEKVGLISLAREKRIEMIRTRSEKRVIKTYAEKLEKKTEKQAAKIDRQSAKIEKQKAKIEKQAAEIKALRAKLDKIENSRSYKMARSLSRLKEPFK